MAVDLSGNGQWLSGNLATAVPLNSDWSMFSWIKRTTLSPIGIQEAPLTMYSQTGSSKNLAVHMWLHSSLGIGGMGNDGATFLESPNVAIDASLNAVWVPVLITSKRTGGASLTTIYTPLGTDTETSDLYMDYQKLGISIGASSQVGGNYFKGVGCRTAHAAFWDKTLSAADYTTLATTSSDPSLVEAANLQAHFPLITDKIDSTGNVTLTTYGTANIIADDPYTGLPDPAPAGPMDPNSITLLHPAAYVLRAMVVQIYNRAVSAGDTAQYDSLRAILLKVNQTSAAQISLDPATDLLTADMANVSRYFTASCKDLVYNAGSTGGPPGRRSAIRSDLQSIYQAINTAATP